MDTSRLPQPGTVVVGRVAGGGVCFAEAVELDGRYVVLGRPGAGRAGDGRIIGQVVEIPKPGTALTLRWDNAFEAFEAHAVVTPDRAATGRDRWTVSLRGSPVRLHRRQTARTPTMLRVKLSIDDCRPAAGLAVDISEGGMRVLLVGDMPPVRRGDVVDVTFALDDIRVSCSALIAHTFANRDDTAKGEYGLTFTNLPGQARQKINQVVRGRHDGAQAVRV